MGCCERLFCCQRARVDDEGSDPLLSKDDETFKAESVAGPNEKPIEKPAAASDESEGDAQPRHRVSWRDEAAGDGDDPASLASYMWGGPVEKVVEEVATGDVLSDAVARAERRKRRQTGFGMVSVPAEDVGDDAGEEATRDRAGVASADQRKRRQTGFVRVWEDSGDEDGSPGEEEDAAGDEDEALARGCGSGGADDEGPPESPTPSTEGVPPGAGRPADDVADAVADDVADDVANDAPATPPDDSPPSPSRRNTWGGSPVSRGLLLATHSERRMSNVSMREMDLDIGDLDLDDSANDAMLEDALGK